jgi:hypothetical protein
MSSETGGKGEGKQEARQEPPEIQLLKGIAMQLDRERQLLESILARLEEADGNLSGINAACWQLVRRSQRRTMGYRSYRGRGNRYYPRRGSYRKQNAGYMDRGKGNREWETGERE